jgi:hypothetical protein
MSTVILHHGTDEASANSLLAHGVSAALAARYNAQGEFWASTSVAHADIFAQTNPAGGPPARFEFELPEDVLHRLLNDRPIVVNFLAPCHYEFLPGSFEILNQCIINKRVVLLP